jgi:uncharacterized protein YqfA (UPF0365 family)
MYFTISYCSHFNVLLIIKFIVMMHSYMYEFIYVFITWTHSISAGFNVNLDLIYGMRINEMKYVHTYIHIHTRTCT